MSDQDNGKVSKLQRPTTDDLEAWKTYWKAQGWTWRTEPEIDEERQKYLDGRRKITPDIEKGVYPFKDIELSRADVEWLLVTHENGRGPLHWSEVRARERDGIDLRGAILSRVDLSYLPLTKMRGGLSRRERFDINGEEHVEWADSAIVHLERADLHYAHLEQAILFRSHLEGAILFRVHLEEAYLSETYFEGANLRQAHLEGEDTNLRNAHLEGTSLWAIHLENAYLSETHLEGVILREAHLEGAALLQTHLEGRSMTIDDLIRIRKWIEDFPEMLPPANLRDAFFDGTTYLKGTILGNKDYGYALLANVSWGSVNLSVVDWGSVRMLGGEYITQQKLPDGKTIDKTAQLREKEIAVRANRQLSVALQLQGLNEEASRFAYHAQKLQRIVLRLQKKFGQYLFSLFVDALAGYGYRPGRAVLWYLVTICVFAIAYHFLGGLSLYPPDAFVFSVMSFHGRGFFPALSQETNLHNPLVMLAALEAIVGLLIEISFIATFTQRFFGR